VEPHVIEVSGCSKSFGTVAVLDDVSLHAGRGEVVALLGPSGCGKSTLLRILAGFEQADRGQVLVDGRPVTGPGPDRGVVDQAATLFPWLSLRDNVAWGPKAAGHPDARAVADRLLEETGLTAFAEAPVSTLSGGMRQRGAVAQSIATGPPVLLLDEPFGALDAQTRIQMHEWLRELLDHRGTTVVLVTHDVDEALMLADSLVLLSARPASVVARMPIDRGDARGREALSHPAAVTLKRRVLDALLS